VNEQTVVSDGGDLWRWDRLMLQRELSPEELAAVMDKARREQCSRVEAWERLQREGGK